MSIAWLHLSVSPLAFSFHLHLPFELLDWNCQLHLALVSLLRTAHCQLPSASLIYISQFHLSCASLTCTSQLHLSHLNLWMSPLMCTSQFHLWYATLTGALGCTSPWNISFAFVDYSFHLQFSFAPLGCTPHSHLGVALGICISCLQLSSSPLTGSFRLHLCLSCTRHSHLCVDLSVWSINRRIRFRISYVALSFTHHVHLFSCIAHSQLSFAFLI